MRSWGLEPGQIEPFLALEDVMNDQGSAEALVQNISARMIGCQFGIILVRWQNGMGHAMVIESKFFLREIKLQYRPRQSNWEFRLLIFHSVEKQLMPF